MSISKNTQDFMSKIDKKINDTKNKSLEIYKNTSIQLLGKLQELSPIVSGRYKSGHTLSLNNPSSFIPPEDSDFSSLTEQQILNAEYLLELIKLEKLINIFINNNLPYADLVENGGINREPHLVYGRAKEYFSQIIKKEFKE